MPFLLSAILFSFPSFAEVAEPNLKWDWEVQQISRKYQNESYPKGTVKAWWADPNYNKKSGLLRKDSPRRYAHMHAMVVAAFYSKRKDERATAMKWLETYECENILACQRFTQFYEGALKANILTIKNKSLRSKAEALREKANKRKSDMDLKPKTGLCAADAERGKWLELEYQLLCPATRLIGKEGFCADCAGIQELKAHIEVDSLQAAMSSSFLRSINHKGEPDCSKPWEVEMNCGGHKEITHRLTCERKGQSYPYTIDCVPLKE